MIDVDNTLALFTEQELVNELLRRCYAAPGRAVVIGIMRPAQFEDGFVDGHYEMGVDIRGTQAECVQMLLSEIVRRTGVSVDDDGRLVIPLPEREESDD